MKDLQGFSPRFGKDVFEPPDGSGCDRPEGSDRRTARRRVEARIKEPEKALEGMMSGRREAFVCSPSPVVFGLLDWPAGLGAPDSRRMSVSRRLSNAR